MQDIQAFGLEAVEQKGVVNLACAGITHAGTVALQGRELVFVEFLRVKEEAADKCGLSVVHAACSEKSQEVFPLVLVEIFSDICSCHSKIRGFRPQSYKKRARVTTLMRVF